MQGLAGSGNGSSAGVGASRQLVILVIGARRSDTANPIMGPPWMMRCCDSALRPAWVRSAVIGVPRQAVTFCGEASASPVSVTMRCVNGAPSIMARLAATAVPGFTQTSPISAGIPPDGTCWPVRISIICFSPPEGYLVGKVASSISAPDRAMAATTLAMASGLLSSMPMRIDSAETICARIWAPSMSSSAWHCISVSSAVM